MANSLLLRQSLRFSSILPKVNAISLQKEASNNLALPATIGSTSSVRWSSFRSSHPVYDISEYPEVEVIKNPPEWKYVERLLPKTIVPQPTPKSEYPSGWKPQSVDLEKEIYYIARTKNHMTPVYLSRKFRGQRRLTIVRRIQGDIWELEIDLKDAIEKHIGKKIASRVNEMSGQIHFKGDYVNFVKEYLMKKGF